MLRIPERAGRARAGGSDALRHSYTNRSTIAGSLRGRAFEREAARAITLVPEHAGAWDPRIGERVLAPPLPWWAFLEIPGLLVAWKRRRYPAQAMNVSVTGALLRVYGRPRILPGKVFDLRCGEGTAVVRARHVAWRGRPTRPAAGARGAPRSRER
jgi:hypothetical protein